MFNKSNLLRVSLAVLLFAVVFWFFRTEIKDLINRVPNTPVIVFPATEESVVIKKDFNTNSLSLEMSRFVPEEAREKELWKLKYVGLDSAFTVGFELKYELGLEKYGLQKIYENYLSVIKSNDWKLLSANLGDLQMFLDVGRKNPAADYKVRISAEQKEGFLDIKIQYLITRD